MALQDIFAMRISEQERAIIEQLARQEERTASDVVRRLIRKAVQTNERAPADRRQDGALVVSTGR